MLRNITVHYAGTLRHPDGTTEPFGPWVCLARHHTRGYRVHIGGDRPSDYHPTLLAAVRESAELSLCGPVSNLSIVEA